MKTAERVVIVALLVVLFGGAYVGYTAVQQKRADYRAEVAAGKFEIRDEAEVAVVETESESPSDWRSIYPNTVPMTLGGVSVEVSVADSMSERIKGLSGTPYLPTYVVKLFAFGVPGTHSIWMKDMNYSLDILWADEDGTIVHIEENVSPDTFPESFTSPTPAWFVVEANAGFVAQHNIQLGDELILPTPTSE